MHKVVYHCQKMIQNNENDDDDDNKTLINSRNNANQIEFEVQENGWDPPN